MPRQRGFIRIQVPVLTVAMQTTWHFTVFRAKVGLYLSSQRKQMAPLQLLID